MGTSYQKSVGDYITFSQNAIYNQSHRIFVNTNIVFIEQVKSSPNRQIVSNKLELTQITDVWQAIKEEASNTLEFSQSYFLVRPVILNTSTTINFSQNIGYNIKSGVASNQLSLTQSIVFTGPISVPVGTSFYFIVNPDESDARDYEVLELSSSVSVNIVSNISVTNYMQLVQLVEKCTYESAANHIHLSQLAEVVLYEIITNVLQPRQTLVVYNLVGTVPSETDDDGRYHYLDWLVMPASNELTLTSTVTPDQITEKPLTTNLDLQQVVDVYLGV